MSYTGPERRASVRRTVDGLNVELNRMFSPYAEINRKCRCLDCGWTGPQHALSAQACPRCDGRVADEGSSEYEKAVKL